ncbi:MAG: hypothetical protein HY814_11810, partial [Candidatus Riflebacteria bacterium]|nr:hypothetical protein [Candidatus Riflebacteria bacterium]
MRFCSRVNWLGLVVIAVLALSLGGCGGGGGSSAGGSGGGGTGGGVTLSGKAFKGPFQASTPQSPTLVTAFPVSNGQIGATPLGSGEVRSSDGSFSLTIEDTTYSGPVVLEVRGRFMDEASRAIQTTADYPLRGVIPSLTAGVSPPFSVQVTPLTHLAVALAQGQNRLNSDGLSWALSYLAYHLNVPLPDRTAPADLFGLTGTESDDSLRYGLVLAGLSQSAASNSVTAMTLVGCAGLDASSDGVLDGKDLVGNAIRMPAATGGWVSAPAQVLGTELTAGIDAFVRASASQTGVTRNDPVVTGLLGAIEDNANRPPVARISVSPTTGSAGTTFQLNGSTSSDPDQVDQLTYNWTVTRGGTAVTVANSGLAVASFVPQLEGTYTIQLVVADPERLTGTATTPLVVTAPVLPTQARLEVQPLDDGLVVYRNQTTTVWLDIRNTGQRTAELGTVSVSSANPGLTFAALTGNPATIAGGNLARFQFRATASRTASLGTFDLSANVTAQDSLEHSNVSVGPITAGRMSVLEQGQAVPLALGALRGPSSILPGRSTTMELQVTNPGPLAVNLIGAELTFSSQQILASLSSENPTTLASGALVWLLFNVQAGPGVGPGTYAIAAAVHARTVVASLGADNSTNDLRDVSGAAATLRVPDTARLRVPDLAVSATTVSQGALVAATYTVFNDSTVAARLTKLALQVGTTEFPPVWLTPQGEARRAWTPGELLLAAGRSILVEFSVPTASLTPGYFSLNALTTAVDSATGTPAPVAMLAPPRTVLVQSGAVLSVESLSPGQSTIVSAGQPVDVTVTVRNSGLATASSVQVSLTFDSSGDVGQYFPYARVSAQPVAVPGGSTATVSFRVTPTWDFSGSQVTVTATANGLDANSAQPIQAVGSTVWQLERGAVLSVAQTPPNTTVTQGQTFDLQYSIRNTGQAAAIDVAAALDIQGTGLTQEVMANPRTVAGGASATFLFRCTAQQSAASGERLVYLTLTATDENSGLALPRLQSSTFRIEVQTPPRLTAGSLVASPQPVFLGQQFTATVPVTNRGGAPAQVTSAVLLFSGAGMRATLRPGTTTLQGHSTLPFTFDSSSDLTATTGVRSASLYLSARDTNTSSAANLDGVSAGSITLLSPGRIAIADLARTLQVSQGQSLVVTVQVQNTGQRSVDVLSATLTASAGITASLRNNPGSIAAGAIVPLQFNTTVDVTATAGLFPLDFSISWSDPATPESASTRRSVGRIQVLQPAVLASVDATAAITPAVVSQGQTFSAEVRLRNSGESAASVAEVALDFDDASGLTIIPAPANPAAVPGATTVVYRFTVTASQAANPTLRRLSLRVRATDANNGALLDFTRANLATVTVQSRADACTVTSFVMPPSATQGSSFSVVATLQNVGQATARDVNVQLGFADATGLTVVPDVNNPIELPGGTTRTFSYNVWVSQSAPATRRTASLTVSANDANSRLPVGEVLSSLGSIDVLAAGRLAFSGGLSAPASVNRGQSFVVRYVLANTGQTAVDMTSATLTFSGGQLTATARSSNPNSILAGLTATFAFDVTAPVNATPGVVIASATASGRDSVTNAATSVSNEGLGFLRVELPASVAFASAVVVPSDVNQGQTVQATVQLVNSGGASAIVSSVSLVFSDPRGISATLVPLPINPSVIAGAATATYTFAIAVDAAAPSGPRDVTAAVVVRDANTLAPLAVSSPPAARMSVLRAADPEGVARFEMPATATQGEEFVVVAQIVNVGESPATELNVDLEFGDETGLTILTEPTNPSTLAAGASAEFRFRVRVWSDAPIGPRVARLTATATDAQSGARVVCVAGNLGTVDILSAGRLAFQGGLVAPATVSKGQDFEAQFVVVNTGQTAVTVTAAELLFVGAPFAITADAANPQVILPGVAATFEFGITVPLTATEGTFLAKAKVSGEDAATHAHTETESTALGFVRVQKPAEVSVDGTLTAPAVVSQGQQFTVTLDLKNSSQAAASVSAVILELSDLRGFTVTPAAGNPTTLPGGSEATFTFTVAVSGSAPIGPRDITATVTAADANSGDALHVDSPAPVTVTVQRVANLATLSSFVMPNAATLGSSFQVVAALTNTGQAPAFVDNLELAFDNMAGLTVIPSALNPTLISGGAAGTFVFTVQVAAAAPVGTRTARLVLTATDGNSGAAIGRTLDLLGTVDILTQGRLAFSGGLTAPASVNQLQTFVAQYTVANTGQTAVNLTATSLTFSTPGWGV